MTDVTDRQTYESNDPVADLPPLRQIISEHGLNAKKSFGQNFLLDLNLTRKIARGADPATAGTIVEVGPGPGGLTRALFLEGAQKVIAIERDRRCIDALTSLTEAAGSRLELLEADALKVDLSSKLKHPYSVVSNLPYNIATPLLINWLSKPKDIIRLVLMFQKEVAERIVAVPGNKTYGRLAVASQWHWQPRKLFDVPASAFTPPPKVTSSIVLFEPLTKPLAPADPEILEAVVAAAFGQRRKMIRTSLKQLHSDTEAWIERADLDPTQRAESLSIEEFCRLAQCRPD